MIVNEKILSRHRRYLIHKYHTISARTTMYDPLLSDSTRIIYKYTIQAPNRLWYINIAPYIDRRQHLDAVSLIQFNSATRHTIAMDPIHLRWYRSDNIWIIAANKAWNPKAITRRKQPSILILTWLILSLWRNEQPSKYCLPTWHPHCTLTDLWKRFTFP